MAGVAARWSPGEGTAIEGGRLTAGVQAHDGLIDTSDVVTVVLDSAPASLQSAGFDGIFVTLGAPAAPAETASAELVVVPREIWQAVRERLVQAGGEAGRAELLKLLRVRDSFVAEFTGPELSNPEKLKEWWEANRPNADFDVELILDRAIAPLGEPAQVWTQRREPAVREVIGGQNAAHLVIDLQVDLEGAPALIVSVFPSIR